MIPLRDENPTFRRSLATYALIAANVAVWAHVGGFLAGVALVGFFCRSDRLTACRSRRGRTHRLIHRAHGGF